MPADAAPDRNPLRARVRIAELLARTGLIKYSVVVRQLRVVGVMRDFHRIALRHLGAEAHRLRRINLESGPIDYYGAFLRAIAAADLAPVHEAYVDEISEIDDIMPLCAVGLDGEYIDEWPRAFLVIVHLVGTEYADVPVHQEVCEKTGVEVCDAREAVGVHGVGTWMKGLPRRGIWRNLRTAVEYALRITGNEFTDCSHNEFCEMGYDVPWTDFEKVVRMWRAARKIHDRAMQLAGWVDENPTERIPGLIQVLQRACPPEVSGPEPRIPTEMLQPRLHGAAYR